MKIDFFDCWYAYVIIILIICMFILLATQSFGGINFDMSSKLSKMNAVTKRLDPFIIQKHIDKEPENGERKRKLEEIKQEGLEVLEGDERLIRLWNSVFMLIESDVPLAAQMQIEIIYNTISLSSSPVGGVVVSSSIPVER